MHITPAYDQGKSYLNLAKFRFCLSTMHFFIQSIILHFVETFHFRDTAIIFQGV